MYSYNEIKTVHLEVTERCNANCAQCARNINGGETNPYLQDRELSIEDIKKIFPKEFIQQLNHMYMCGNYGDPIVAKDTLEIFKYFRDCNKTMLLSMNTNASARTKEWWESLVEVLGSKSFVVFSIDGLQDTNHIYRRNTNWDKIMSAAKSFINAGGNAHWEYIVFKHNEHQVEEAEQMAKDLGFSKFQVKKTSRFFSHLTGKIRKHQALVDKHGNKIDLQLPDNSKYRNEGHENLDLSSISNTLIKIPTTYDEVKDSLNPELFNYPMIEAYNNTEIECKVQKEKSIFISAEGILHPCCWVGSTMYSWFHMYKRTQIWKYINKVGLDKINTKLHSIKEILDGPYLKLIEESWNKPTCSQGKLVICSRTCGKNLETFSKQFA